MNSNIIEEHEYDLDGDPYEEVKAGLEAWEDEDKHVEPPPPLLLKGFIKQHEELRERRK